MHHPKFSKEKIVTLLISSVLVLFAAGVSVAFAALTFTGTSINGDSNSVMDATGTVSIGASSATGITIGRSGITATFPGTVTITGTTTTLQNLVVSGNCTGCGVGNFSAGGDLSGSSTAQTVIGLQGRAVSSTAPSTNQVLTWNGSFWTPANTGSGITAINGLSNSTTSIVAGTNITITTSSPNVITISGTGAGAITINGLTTSTFSIQGTANQITVATTSPNILTLSLPQSIATASTPTFAGLNINGNATTTNVTISGITGSTQCLHVNSSGVVSGTGSDCGSGAGGTITLDGITSSTFSFAAGGTGLAVASSANPNTVTYTWTNPGYVLSSGNNSWTGAQTFNATTTFLGPIVESSTGAGSVQLAEGNCPSGSSGNDILCADSTLHALKSSFNGGSYFAIPQLAGDIGGTASTPEVVGLQGRAVSSTAPSTNQVLTWNGTFWTPMNASGTGGSGSGSVTTSSAITANNFPFWATTTGGLSGTSTLSVSGNTITNSGNAQIGGTLNVTGTASFAATTTFLGAIQGGSSNSTEGMQIMEGACPSAVSGSDILCASSSSHAFQTSFNGGSYFSIPQLAGDLGGTASTPEVVGLQGRAVSSTAPSTNQVLTWNGSSWAPANASGSSSGITAINGLSNSTTSIAAGSGISISTSSPNIITITATGGSGSSTWSALTNPTTNLSLGMGDYATALTYGTTTTVTPFLIQDTTGNTATSSLFQVSTVGTSVASPVKFTAQGTANGVQMNSSGTLNAIGTGNINATQIQGISVATATPSTNQVLTYNGSSWAPANASGTGGGGSGSVTTSSAITANNFPYWATTTGGLSGTSTLSISGNTVTNSGNANLGGTLNVTGTASFATTTTVLGNVAFGTSTTNSGANMFASYGTTGTTTLMLGATTTPRTGCIELVGDGGTTVYYLTISSAGALQISSSTCL